MGVEDDDIRKAIKDEGDKIEVKPALGKIRQQTEGKSPKDTDEKAGDRKK
jgi:hypothetical protein